MDGDDVVCAELLTNMKAVIAVAKATITTSECRLRIVITAAFPEESDTPLLMPARTVMFPLLPRVIVVSGGCNVFV